MEDIRRAVMHATAAGKLRVYVRESGGGLAGLIRLADRHTAAATAALQKVGPTHCSAGPGVPGRGGLAERDTFD